MFQHLSETEFLLIDMERCYACMCLYTLLHLKREKKRCTIKFLFLNSVVFKNSSLVFTIDTI